MIDSSQKVLLELLKASLFQITPQFPEEVDWDAVYEEAKAQTVIALAAPALPPSEQAKWMPAVQQNTAHYMRLLYEQGNLVRLFRAAGIPMVILKGTAAAMYYPVPSRRTMGDIDFLVPPECFEASERLMSENGYEIENEINPRHIGYGKGGILFEMHRYFSVRGLDIESLILPGLSCIETGEVNRSTFPLLPSKLNGLILLAHIRQHLVEAIGIRQIIDWMMYVHCMLDDETWYRDFQPLAQASGLEILAVTVTRICKDYFGLPDPITWCDDADEALSAQLADLIFSSGNFGIKKDTPDSVEKVAVSVREMGVFHFLQSAGESNWAAAKRYPFLRPFAWLYQIIRFIRRGLRARVTPNQFRDEHQSFKDRVNFFKKLGID